MTTILIVDDHDMVRDGLCRVIEEDPSMTVVGQASSGAEALGQCKQLKPDVVVLDVVMPGRDSLEIVDELKRRHSSVRVLMLTGLPGEQYALRCLRAGADGYLSKAKAADELLGAIHRVAVGGKYISDALATLLAINVGKDLSRPQHERLSNRELQVMRLIGSGKTISEIADMLNLSPKTVSTYRARILAKTELRNSAEIIRYALKHGLTLEAQYTSEPPSREGVF